MRVATSLALVGTLGTLAAWLGGCGAAGDREQGAVSTFRRAVVARGFDSPVHIASTKSEPRRLYVVEQDGTIRVLERGRLRSGLFLDISRRVVSGGEQGLLGLAFDPRYANNRLIYVNYTDNVGDTRIVRYRTNGRRAIPSSARLLLEVEQPYANHNGGNLVFGPDGFLYVGLGDGGAGGDPEERAQNPDTFLGKMLRVDVRRLDRRPEIVALGLRNPWRYSFDRANGDLYIGDVGQNELEEIDYTPARSGGLENYGWDLYEGSRRYERGSPGPGELVFPIHEYGREGGNCTVVGGFVYRGRARPAERGRYIFGDYCSGVIWSLRVRSGKAQSVRREPFRIEGLTSFGEDVAGELYAVSQDGVVYRLT